MMVTYWCAEKLHMYMCVHMYTAKFIYTHLHYTHTYMYAYELGDLVNWTKD